MSAIDFGEPWIDPELQAKFRALHGPRAELAERRFLMLSALAVYEAACSRCGAAEERLLEAMAEVDAARAVAREAMQTAGDWCAIVHGLSLAYAAERDAAAAHCEAAEYVTITRADPDEGGGGDPAR